MAAPGTEHPIVWPDVLKDADHRLFVPAVEMDGRADFPGVEKPGDLGFEVDEILRGEIGNHGQAGIFDNFLRLSMFNRERNAVKRVRPWPAGSPLKRGVASGLWRSCSLFE